MSMDTREFRRALGCFATGITVITARDAAGMPVGLTANSFNSVSLDPPLVLWSLSLYSNNLAAFQNCSHWAVNVLAADQQALSQRFAQTEGNRFGGLDFSEGLGGAPLLEGCCARFECRNETHYAGGDHLIFLGEVERYERFERPPLLYFGGRYRQLGTD
ncbi:MAG: flavin reductase family protein [Rhodocyclaceae bacterium]|nr:flavin reductase family protein [Rhodocyclaceae bacterium]MBX3668576.1 flavin reductase family protein [Rhodocyclaceae bacterium]